MPPPMSFTGCCFQRDAEDFADGQEVGIDRIPPVVIEIALTIPFAGFLLGSIGEFVEREQFGFNDHWHGHLPPLMPLQWVYARAFALRK